jgi:hypothetical protein
MICPPKSNGHHCTCRCLRCALPGFFHVMITLAAIYWIWQLGCLAFEDAAWIVERGSTK